MTQKRFKKYGWKKMTKNDLERFFAQKFTIGIGHYQGIRLVIDDEEVYKKLTYVPPK